MPAAVLTMSMHLKRHSWCPLTLRQEHDLKELRCLQSRLSAVWAPIPRKPSLLVDIHFGEDAKAVTLGRQKCLANARRYRLPIKRSAQTSAIAARINPASESTT